MSADGETDRSCGRRRSGRAVLARSQDAGAGEPVGKRNRDHRWLLQRESHGGHLVAPKPLCLPTAGNKEREVPDQLVPVPAPADPYELVPLGSPEGWYNLDELRAADPREAHPTPGPPPWGADGIDFRFTGKS